jgi:acetylornithine deacetylase/succinyl-diaminopimelate desuccinylase-like protein
MIAVGPAAESAGAVRAAVAERRAQLVDLVRALVRERSENPPGDERAAVARAAAALETVPGTDLRVVEQAPGRPSLVAAVGPRGYGTLLFGAHLDTVPAGQGWARPPFSADLEHGRVYGRGTSDNKGAVAALSIALAALAELGVTTHHRVIVVANADEEAGGGLGMDVVRDRLDEEIDAAVICEPSGIDRPFERLWIAARGASRFTLTTRGTGTHTSLIGRPDVCSAVDQLETALAALRAELSFLQVRGAMETPRAEMIVVRIAGGQGWGVVPPEASADVELRVSPGLTRDDVERELAEALSRCAAHVRLEFAAGSMRWVEPSQVAVGHAVVRAASDAWGVVLGAPPRVGCFPGGTDARSLAEVGIPVISGLGPGTLLRSHGPDEYVTVEELLTAAELYALTAISFLTSTRRNGGTDDRRPD